MYCICIENELDLYKNEVIHMANAVLQTRIDKATKDQAEDLFESLGLDITTAIRLFLKQAIKKIFSTENHKSACFHYASRAY